MMNALRLWHAFIRVTMISLVKVLYIGVLLYGCDCDAHGTPPTRFFRVWNDTSLYSTHRSYLANSNLARSNRRDSAMNLRNIGESQVTVGCIFPGHKGLIVTFDVNNGLFQCNKIVIAALLCTILSLFLDSIAIDGLTLKVFKNEVLLTGLVPLIQSHFNLNGAQAATIRVGKHFLQLI